MTNQSNTRTQSILRLISMALLLSWCALSVSTAASWQEENEEARRVRDERFFKDARAGKRPAPQTAPPSRPKKPGERRSDVAGSVDGELIGVTFWRLSPVVGENRNLPAAKAPQTEPKLMIPTAGGVAQQYRATRVSDDATFNNGDLLWLGIEVPRVTGGYVYVIDREEYNDGTLGEPYLIFPGTKTPAGANIASAGKIVQVPAKGDPLPYFRLERSSAKHIGERLTIIVSPRQLSLTGRTEQFGQGIELLKLDAAQVEKWEQQWSGKTQRLDARGTVGKGMTVAEKDAAEHKQLVPTDLLPQTIYGVEGKLGNPVLVTVPLKIASQRSQRGDARNRLGDARNRLNDNNKPKLILEKGHSFPVRSVAFSPDGRLLASGSHDRTIKIWDAVIKRELRTMIGHTDAINCVAFTPDGSKLVSGSKDKTIKVWDVKTGETLRTLLGLENEVREIAVSPDGQFIASAGEVHVKLWELATGRPLKDLGNAVPVRLGELDLGKNQQAIGHKSDVYTVAFSPDSKKLVSGGMDGKVIIWDLISGDVTGSASVSGNLGYLHMSLSADGQMLAIVTNGTAELLDLVTRKKTRTINIRTGYYIHASAFSPDGKVLGIGSLNQIKLWNAITGQEIRTLTGHKNIVNDLKFSPDGQSLASGSGDFGGEWDNNIHLWEPATGKEKAVLDGWTNVVIATAYSRDGKMLACATSGAEIRLWDITNGKPVGTLSGHVSNVTSLAFSPDGHT
ncbi:MAG: WD40 repeat domain-containing protein, partial [Acidobacteriota bacterium]|nr:WD40 repeat domain-containing protein [Acidobacteriota bacterium]